VKRRERLKDMKMSIDLALTHLLSLPTSSTYTHTNNAHPVFTKNVAFVSLGRQKDLIEHILSLDGVGVHRYR
jgi:hypothetical protein